MPDTTTKGNIPVTTFEHQYTILPMIEVTTNNPTTISPTIEAKEEETTTTVPTTIPPAPTTKGAVTAILPIQEAEQAVTTTPTDLDTEDAKMSTLQPNLDAEEDERTTLVPTPETRSLETIDSVMVPIKNQSSAAQNTVPAMNSSKPVSHLSPEEIQRLWEKIIQESRVFEEEIQRKRIESYERIQAERESKLQETIENTVEVLFNTSLTTKQPTTSSTSTTTTTIEATTTTKPTTTTRAQTRTRRSSRDGPPYQTNKISSV